jgi:hypothetical protein
VLAGLAATGSRPGHAQDVAVTPATSEPVLYVHLIDEVNLANDVRDRFIAEVERGLRAASVRSIWLNCPNKLSPHSPAGCGGELAGAVSIRIWPRKMMGRDLALGYSVAGPDGGTYGTICYPTVERAAQIAQVPVVKLLALATLHEIGHLLLGSNAHWPWGIMNPFWERGRFNEMLERGVHFNVAQAKLMRARVAARRGATARN